MLDALSQMVRSDLDGIDLFEAALEGDSQFSLEAKKLIGSISRSNHFSPELYLTYYLDVASGLRDLSQNYIRLFSANKKDMLSNYKILTNVANRWSYIDEFSKGAQDYRNSLDSEDDNKRQRENSFQQSVELAKETIVETNKILAELASNSAAGKRCN
jgi:hypothetical protein